MTSQLVWTGAVFAVLLAVLIARAIWRLARWHRGVSSEERRLRDDPRFAELWVRQFRSHAPPADEGAAPQAPIPGDDGARPAPPG